MEEMNELDAFFRPVNRRHLIRHHRMFVAEDARGATNFIEVELTREDSLELLSEHCNLVQFSQYMIDKIVWVDESMFLVLRRPELGLLVTDDFTDYEIFYDLTELFSVCYSLDVWSGGWRDDDGIGWDGGEVVHSFELYVYVPNTLTDAEVAESAAPAIEFLNTLAATSRVTTGIVCCGSSSRSYSISTAALDCFVTDNESLQWLQLEQLYLDTEHCEILETVSRPSLDVSLDRCCLTREGVIALAEGMTHNRGPTRVSWYNLDQRIFANALRGNTSLRAFYAGFYEFPVSDENVGIYVVALAENKGLVTFGILYEACSDHNWTLLCDAVKTHRNLRELIFQFYPDRRRTSLTREQKRARTVQLANALHFNSFLHRVSLGRLGDYDETIYNERIVPRLAMNRARFRLQRETLTNVECDLLKAQLLALALHTAQFNRELSWQILNENCVVFSPNTQWAGVVAVERRRNDGNEPAEDEGHDIPSEVGEGGGDGDGHEDDGDAFEEQDGVVIPNLENGDHNEERRDDDGTAEANNSKDGDDNDPQAEGPVAELIGVRHDGNELDACVFRNQPRPMIRAGAVVVVADGRDRALIRADEVGVVGDHNEEQQDDDGVATNNSNDGDDDPQVEAPVDQPVDDVIEPPVAELIGVRHDGNELEAARMLLELGAPVAPLQLEVQGLNVEGPNELDNDDGGQVFDYRMVLQVAVLVLLIAVVFPMLE